MINDQGLLKSLIQIEFEKFLELDENARRPISTGEFIELCLLKGFSTEQIVLFLLRLQAKVGRPL